MAEDKFKRKITEFIEGLERSIEASFGNKDSDKMIGGDEMNSYQFNVMGQTIVLTRLYVAFPEIRSPTEANRRLDAYNNFRKYKP
ncbi:hypothetical protein J4466_05040 [Candidatus Pacearchaeota archaeon]|nr:hypothetical protein [Candidatus Pacearchaeota archaeon]